jgi:glucose/arabinose dehydrogenase
MSRLHARRFAARNRFGAFAALLVASTAFTACGDDEDDDDGTGGSTAARGGTSSGKGGTSGTTGKGGSGGTAGSSKGGSAGTGTGGTAGGAGENAAGDGAGGDAVQGGAGGDDGVAGDDGAAGLGGAGGAGGAAPLPDPCRGIPLPEDQHYVAPGLCASAVAVQQGRLRQIAFTSNGDLIGVRVTGEIVRYRDENEDGMFEGASEIVTIASTGGNGNNAHVDEVDGYLYAGADGAVLRWEYDAASDDLGEPESVVTSVPSTGTHTYHTVHVHEGWLYVHAGSEDNAVAPASPDYDTERAVIKRFELAEFDAEAPFEWADGDVFVRGVRNMVGFTHNAEGDFYGVDNGIDNLQYGGTDVHLDNPGEDLDHLVAGQAYGYPYCFTASNITDSSDVIVEAGTQLSSATDSSQPDPDFVNPHDDAWCEENATPPVTFLPAHAAPLDIKFYESVPQGGLPDSWWGGAFVALHGSWNTSPSVGHSVVLVPFVNGSPSMPEASDEETDFPHIVVFGGGNASSHDDGIWGWSSGENGEDPVRPVSVAVSPIDGALYVSSDNATVSGGEAAPLEGALYRIGIRQ